LTDKHHIHFINTVSSY